MSEGKSTALENESYYQLIFVKCWDTLATADMLIHERLGESWLIKLVMSPASQSTEVVEEESKHEPATVNDEIDDDILSKLN